MRAAFKSNKNVSLFGCCTESHICADVKLPHLAKQMLQEVVKLLLFIVGQPHAGGHLISCRGVDTACQH